ncbi:AI-2E family transporter [Flexithrix dorotheae]|uniref:AI-2E family transporter n=1 Tax=Flexithrix dorotheae TaxID=70993 RepID=UPI00036AF058|nr:AI-2E family transporter [Flexithrix dorotheae]
MSKNFPLPLVSKLTILMLFWILLFYFLELFRNVLYPLCIAILFAFLLYPVARFFEKKLFFPRILSNIISIIFGIAVVYGAVFFIYKQLGVFINDLPAMERQAINNLVTLVTSVETLLDLNIENKEVFLIENIKELTRNLGQNISIFLSATTNTIFSIFILPVYIFFFLYYRNKFRDFILKLIPEKNQTIAHKTLNEVSVVTKKYMSGVFFVVFILCFVNSIGLMIVGVEHAVLLGVIAAIINFIPYFGTIIGYLFPFIFALLTGDSPNLALGVIVLFIIVQFTENNILTPNIVGGSVRINPFVIILSVLLGGYVWGIPGMFISVPLVAMIKILCDNVESLKPWSFLLGDEGTEEHALTIGKFRKFFHFNKKTMPPSK